MLKSDASSLRNLGKALRQSQPALYKATKSSLRAEGAKIAERAKRNFDWSTRIPQTVKVRTSGVASVIITAGDKTAPHAKPIEHAGASGTFRHPVFGNTDVWVDQPARPSLHPAALEHLQESAEAVGAALTVQVEKTIHGQDIFL
jgi:hypothetical protein